MTEKTHTRCVKCDRVTTRFAGAPALPCACEESFMSSYLKLLQRGERNEVIYFGPAIDRLQSEITLIDAAGFTYKLDYARLTRNVHKKLLDEMHALKMAALDVVDERRPDAMANLRALVAR